MPGLNGEPTSAEVLYYKSVLQQARHLLSLRGRDPIEDEEIRLAAIELQTLIDSDPANRFWTKITGNPLKEGCDLLLSSRFIKEANAPIENYLKLADVEAKIIERASVELKPMNQILNYFLNNRS